jgi:prevent-host-death family protein
MNVVRDIQSLSIFKRDASKIIKQIKATKEPVVLTVNGIAEVVVQDAASYQKLVEAKERAETVAILRERLADRSGETKTLEEVFTKLAEDNGFKLEDDEV